MSSKSHQNRKAERQVITRLVKKHERRLPSRIRLMTISEQKKYLIQEGLYNEISNESR